MFLFSLHIFYPSLEVTNQESKIGEASIGLDDGSSIVTITELKMRVKR